MVAGPRNDGSSQSIPGSPTSPDKRTVSIVDNRIGSKELFAAAREITISHGEDVYRLRLTSQNKLILTK
ncbi:MAG: hemin uptake protein HemP [Afipia sp.]|nr:hemin uptake protein HemP [Afipia sp.]OJW66264.1 MAG: hypothetical protein BGO65_04300 [Afipia sp. 64-13]